MNWIDYVVVGVYLFGLVFFDFLLSKQSSGSDYYLGGRSIGWFPLTLSTMAIQLKVEKIFKQNYSYSPIAYLGRNNVQDIYGCKIKKWSRSEKSKKSEPETPNEHGFSVPRLIVILFIGLLLFCLSMSKTKGFTFTAKQSGEFRFDDKTGRGSRVQYRYRLSTDLQLLEHTSIGGHVATGSSFDSSHRTFGETNAVYLRRLFLRHEKDDYRYELGVIPTFKGYVSASGLDKDGFIKGGRVVKSFSSGNQLEFVVGELEKRFLIGLKIKIQDTL